MVPGNRRVSWRERGKGERWTHIKGGEKKKKTSEPFSITSGLGEKEVQPKPRIEKGTQEAPPPTPKNRREGDGGVGLP